MGDIQTPLWQALRRIHSHADTLEPFDRELLWPAFAALDGAQAISLPAYVIARIRDIDARMPK
jgi:hypothetical protein